MRANWHRAEFVLVLATGLFAAFPASAQVGQFAPPERVNRELKMYKIDAPPTIDGALSDPVWKRLPRHSGMMDITFEHAYVADQMLVSACYDDENIYVAVDLRDRFPELIHATVKTRDVHLWAADDDTVELFFDPGGNGVKYIQIACNPRGTQWDMRKGDAIAWNGAWTVATRRTSKGWQAEFKIPFSDLPVTPTEGMRLRANLARTTLGGKEQAFSSWSYLQMAFNSTRDFGDWIFAGPAPDRKPDELAINKEFVEKEIRRFRHGIRELSNARKLARALGERFPAEAQEKLSEAETLGKELEKAAEAFGPSTTCSPSVISPVDWIRFEGTYENCGACAGSPVR